MYGFFSLLRAAASENVFLLNLFLSNGAAVNATLIFGFTALHEALDAENSNEEVVQILIKNGSDVNAEDVHGETPLSMFTLDCLFDELCIVTMVKEFATLLFENRFIS